MKERFNMKGRRGEAAEGKRGKGRNIRGERRCKQCEGRVERTRWRQYKEGKNNVKGRFNMKERRGEARGGEKYKRGKEV